ncbi:lipopolysaccharide assembly protein LapB [Chryseobacterium sp. JUb7]|uniref:tetratricopeptide repeat protein n=1 Tax=Chryseobacterium sp. JUb7 TaxID=2940599 RepID=UPI00216846D5|nr:hypothetical protein [Chryseobacterium sp. JUb7]MCS3528712.1 tetratricopeptide (TPR) repeat protein [Chryseobacterium sp. JUb7]
MKMRLLFLFFISFSLNCNSQIEHNHLINEWYIYKIEMQDGSKPFLLKDIHSSKHYSIIIDKTDYYLVNDQQLIETRKDPVFKTKYNLIGNKLITSPESYLTIEKLNKDSLILSQNIKGFESKDLQRYYYVRKVLAIEEEIKKNEKKDTLRATSILGPRFRPFLIRRMLKDLTNTKPLKEKLPNFKFNGYILINLKRETIDIKLNEYDKNFINEINLKNQQFYKFSNWNFSSVSNFEVIKIPFSFVSYYTLDTEIETYGDVCNLFTLHFLTDFDPTYEEVKKSTALFTKALQEYKKNNYTKAIEFFDLSYQINPKNLDAYYNSADINFALGEKNRACKIWHYLKLEGQKFAENQYELNCN